MAFSRLAACGRIGLVFIMLLWQTPASVGLPSASAQGASSSSRVDWKPVPGEEHFEIALSQDWVLPAGSRIDRFRFSAIRFHLGYFQLKLLGVADFAKGHVEDIARPQNVDPSLSSLLELGLAAVFKAKPFQNLVAVVPAGFPASEKKPINLGLLKTDGVTQSQLLAEGPSAVLCLDSPKFQGKGYQFQLPVFYRTEDERQQNLIRQCRDAVQVGPRILEDPTSLSKDSAQIQQYARPKDITPNPWPVYLGVSQKVAGGRSAYSRTVILLDDPGREDRKEGDGKSKDLARNAYIVVTDTPVTFVELQSMLTSEGFYANDRYAPYWAVNLVGGDYAGMIIGIPDQDKPTSVGNTTITQASVLAILRK